MKKESPYKKAFWFAMAWLISSIIMLALSSCKKDSTTQPLSKTSQPTVNGTCAIDISLFKDVVWNSPDTNIFASLQFKANGYYLEDTVVVGSWNQSNGCDSIHATKNALGFYYRIVSVKSDSLYLLNPVFGIIGYRK